MKKLNVETNLYYYQDDYACQKTIKHLRGDTYYYADWGNLAITDLADLYEISTTNKKRTLIQFLKQIHNYNSWDFTWAKHKEDVITEIMNSYSINSIKDFIYDLEKFGIEFERKFHRYVSKGYRQGDVVEIFLPYQLAEVWGCTREEFEKQVPNLYKRIDQYCWDSEISGQINISFSYEVKRETFGDSVEMEFDEEFEYQDWSNDVYEIDVMIHEILTIISLKTHQSLSLEDLQMIRRELESIDYTYIEN